MQQANPHLRYFIYARKSTEGEDRQVQSIDSQLKVLTDMASENGLTIVEILREMKSAKAPYKRPVFAAMLTRIGKGDANGILVWHPDRLSRNAVDTGLLVHMMDEGDLLEVRMPGQALRNTPQEKFLFSLLCGQAKLENDNKSINVRRGATTKFEAGGLAGRAPVGYKNDRNTKTVVRDPERFPVIRKAWELMLSGVYTVPEVGRWLDREGFRTMKRKKTGGGRLATSALYRIFDNLFYAGTIRREGREILGRHEPMITMAEFDRVQTLVHRHDAPRPSKHVFAFARLFRCGECGSMITAERKSKTLKSTGEKAIYTYYHCARHRRLVACSQRSHLTESELWSEIKAALKPYAIYKEFSDEALRIVRRRIVEGGVAGDPERVHLEERRSLTRSQLSTLTDLRVRRLITDDEFRERRAILMVEQEGLERQLRAVPHPEERLRRVEQAFVRLKELDTRLEKASTEERRQLLAALCSNRTILNKKPAFRGEELLTEVAAFQLEHQAAFRVFELSRAAGKTAPTGHVARLFPVWKRVINKVTNRFLSGDIISLVDRVREAIGRAERGLSPLDGDAKLLKTVQPVQKLVAPYHRETRKAARERRLRRQLFEDRDYFDREAQKLEAKRNAA